MNYQDKHHYEEQPIPQGYVEFVDKFAVVGTTRRLDMVKTALDAKNVEPNMVIEHEPDNDNDPNALKVIVKRKMFFFLNTNFHIGYIPHQLAGIICKNGLQDSVQLRAIMLINYETGTKAVICQLIGESQYMTPKLRKELNYWDQ